MAKQILAMIAAILVVTSFAFISETKASSRLGCPILASCGGEEECGGDGKGDVYGCEITCTTGTKIVCPPVSPE